MLIEFSVANYRSIAEKQTFSMTTKSCNAKTLNYAIPTGNRGAPCVLKTACLFGPNGVGKSNLINALGFFQRFVVSSAKDTQQGENIKVRPFMLDSDLKDAPSEFEASFVHNEMLYQYGFSANRERVIDEWLFAKPNVPRSRMREIFQRNYIEKTGEYAWDLSEKHLRGQKEVWKSLTRDNALFLSTAVQFKSEDLLAPFTWIRWYLRIVTSSSRVSPGYTIKQGAEQGNKDAILNLLLSADVGIADLKFETKQDKELEIRDEFREKLEVAFKSLEGDIKLKFDPVDETQTYDVKSVHKSRQGKDVTFNFGVESEGTRTLFGLAGPFLDTLKNGFTLVIDELNNSLHPYALRFLVSLFQNSKTNLGNAQLIFTSHETSVMAKNFLHRDQIWLMEKENSATQLYALSSFNVREFEAFQRAYLDGRFGGVPKIRELVYGKA